MKESSGIFKVSRNLRSYITTFNIYFIKIFFSWTIDPCNLVILLSTLLAFFLVKSELVLPVHKVHETELWLGRLRAINVSLMEWKFCQWVKIFNLLFSSACLCGSQTTLLWQQRRCGLIFRVKNSRLQLLDLGPGQSWGSVSQMLMPCAWAFRYRNFASLNQTNCFSLWLSFRWIILLNLQCTGLLKSLLAG